MGEKETASSSTGEVRYSGAALAGGSMQSFRAGDTADVPPIESLPSAESGARGVSGIKNDTERQTPKRDFGDRQGAGGIADPQPIDPGPGTDLNAVNVKLA